MNGPKDGPWILKTPPGRSERSIYLDEAAQPPLLVCLVGTTRPTRPARVLDDLPAILREHGDWMPLGACDDGKEPAPGAVEAGADRRRTRSAVGRAQRSCYYGRLPMYIAPLPGQIGQVDPEHDPKNNRIRARAGGPEARPPGGWGAPGGFPTGSQTILSTTPRPFPPPAPVGIGFA